MEIPFAAIKALGNRIELYINVGEGSLPHTPISIHRETVSSYRGHHEGGTSYVDAGGNDTNDLEAAQDQSTINLNSVLEVLMRV